MFDHQLRRGVGLVNVPRSHVDSRDDAVAHLGNDLKAATIRAHILYIFDEIEVRRIAALRQLGWAEAQELLGVGGRIAGRRARSSLTRSARRSMYFSAEIVAGYPPLCLASQ